MAASSARAKPRSAGTGGLYQDARGLWTAVVELPDRDGKRRRKVIRSKSKSVAAAKLKKTRADLDKAGDLTTSSPTLTAWLALWLVQIAAPRLKPRTLATYKGYIKTHIVPSIGKHKLDKLTPDHVRKLHGDMAAKGCSGTTQLQAHRILAKALTDALREGRVTRNVATLLDAPRKAKRRTFALDAEEAKQLLAAHADDPAAFASLAVALLAGLRQGERLGLTIGQLDLTKEVLTVSWQLQRLTWEHGCGPLVDHKWPCGYKQAGACPKRHVYIPPDQEAKRIDGGLWMTRPKSPAGWREIPMTGALVEVMRRYLALTPPGMEGLVFHREDGRPIDPRVDSEAWHAALESADLPSVRLHTARHTCATLLAALGVPEHVRVRILGHATAAMTGVYTHATDREARAAIQALGDLVLPSRGETKAGDQGEIESALSLGGVDDQNPEARDHGHSDGAG